MTCEVRTDSRGLSVRVNATKASVGPLILDADIQRDSTSVAWLAIARNGREEAAASGSRPDDGPSWAARYVWPGGANTARVYVSSALRQAHAANQTKRERNTFGNASELATCSYVYRSLDGRYVV